MVAKPASQQSAFQLKYGVKDNAHRSARSVTPVRTHATSVAESQCASLRSSRTSIRLHDAKIKLSTLLSCFGENGAGMEVCEALKGVVCECRSVGLLTKDLMEAREWLIAAELERCICGDCKSCIQSMSLAELRLKLVRMKLVNAQASHELSLNLASTAMHELVRVDPAMCSDVCLTPSYMSRRVPAMHEL